MDTAEISKAKPVSLTQEADKSWDDELQQLVQTLLKEEGWFRGTSLYLYQGCWFSAAPAGGLKAVISFQRHFQALIPMLSSPLPKMRHYLAQGLDFLHLASRDNPMKLLFLRYEDLKEDIVSQVKQLAMFLGVPFTEEEEEEKQGVVKEIAKICSFDYLKELEVNRKGIDEAFGIPHENYFRKGEVGDWRNYLTPTIIGYLEKLMQEELGNSGFAFKLSSKTSKV
ncbi:Cytosolic sulfotransferase 14 [Hibiscus syriacus]|uniref:Sulfotransferase n=1 Tax=Hibiscus syriacus TaxID=106335 RepID=A0A6A3C4Z6_HIBSY|nr:Cytosolic sulfotransferase 14 [Hibiscus syriacus]